MAFYIPGPTDLGYNQATDTVTNTSGEDAQLPLATDELNGLMSAAHRALTEALIGAGVDVEGSAVLIPHIHGDLAGSVYIHVKNTSGGQLAKGTPVRVVGQVGDTTMLEVAAANSASSNTMPAIGLLADTLAQNGTGHAVVAGELTGLNTGSYGINQSLFVASGGGLTGTAPTSGITQQIAIVGRVHANTGTVTVTVGTPLSLVTSTTAGLARPQDFGDVIVLACSDETTDLATGTARVTFRMPWAATLTAVRLSVNTAPTGSALIADVNEGGVSVFSTRPQIDINTRTSVGSAVTPVISDSSLAADAEITVDIDQVGSTIRGRGLKVALYVTRA